MNARRATLLALAGLVSTIFCIAFGCSLDELTGEGETNDEICSVAAHCDDDNPCTDDACGADGLCTHTPNGTLAFTDGVPGNCRHIVCDADGNAAEELDDTDNDDFNDCTTVECKNDGATVTTTTGAGCALPDGSTGLCDSEGKCVVECSGPEDCMPSDPMNPCIIAFCDQGQGKCGEQKLTGVVAPGTTASECGTTFCKDGKASKEDAPTGTQCGTNGAFFCDGEGACQECNVNQDCNPDGTPEGFCFQAKCNTATHLCENVEKTNGTPMPMQTDGDCKEWQCQALVASEEIDDNDTPDDSNPCTQNLCNAGVPGFAPELPDTPCVDMPLDKICDGQNNCVECNDNADCQDPLKGICFNHVCVDMACTNMVKDANETDLDCGGACGPTCAVGKMCAASDNNCVASAYCSGGLCAAKKNNSAACGAGNECVSGQCVDGVCCNTSCMGLCQACDVTGAAGVCTAIPNGTDPDMDCAGSDVCATGSVCLNGQGDSCMTGAECATGQCIDGVCCNTACNGLCMACSNAKTGQANGTCSPVSNGLDPDNECAGGTSCNGQATPACALFGNGTPCGANNECGSNFCVDGYCCNNACGSTCQACSNAKSGGANGTCTTIPANQDPDNECASGACGGSTSCKLDNGQGCMMNGQCLSNACADQFCCNSACSGTCQACSNAKSGGVNGTCTAVPNGNDPDAECAGATTCNGANACALFATGTACTLSNGSECTSGFCADGFCCNNACTSTCQACSNTKSGGANGTCTNIPLNQDPDNECANGACGGTATCKSDNGQSCTMTSQCLSGNCADNFCCNTACGSLCQACSNALTNMGNGTCNNVKTGSETSNECPGATTCNGAGACGLLANGTACTIADGSECMSGHCVENVCCDLTCSGTCQSCLSAKTGDLQGKCANITADTDPDSECSGGNVCDAGACVPGPDGVGCGAAGECSSGFCVDNVCCEDACSGLCKACNSIKTGMTSGTCNNITTGIDPDTECSGASVCSGGACTNGATCTMGGQCTSTFCAPEGVCCDNACSGTCRVCDGTFGGTLGTCHLIPAGTDDPVTPCPGPQVCDGGGSCL